MEDTIKNMHPEVHWEYILSVIATANEARRVYLENGDSSVFSTYFNCIKHLVNEIPKYQGKCLKWGVPILLNSQRELAKAKRIYFTATKTVNL